MITAFTNARIFDGLSAEIEADTVIIEGDEIREVGRGLSLKADRVIDCVGRRLMPGLIDAHVHVYAHDVNLTLNERRPMTLLAHRAAAMLGRALKRGFTTVRDCGGADYGLALAIEGGWITAPRLFFCGQMLSQSGGHGDFRHPHEHDDDDFCWSCGSRAGHIAQTVDGDVEVRRAVRETLRRGASFIKFAASGGVTSIAGSVGALQFGEAEIVAIVEEVERAGAYCTAHVHPDAGIRRAIELGVHCLEHASMISPDTARFAAEHGTFIVPTLAVAGAIADHGEALGYAPQSLAKLGPVRAGMVCALDAMRNAGVKIGFGTDMLGPLEIHQCREFVDRAEVFSPIEILRQATSMNATIMAQTGLLGAIAAGARADLLVMARDPLEDISVFDADGSAIDIIVSRGQTC
jgi:imidazolonepropionase-like amidohydrolase